MRVNITYSVEEEDLIAELGHVVLGLKGDMESVISLYNRLPAQLSEGLSGAVEALDMLRNFKNSLHQIDVRLDEVGSILESVQINVQEEDNEKTNNEE